VWEERAYRARRDIAALAASGLGVSDLHSEAIRLIDDKIGTDLTCWATIDPETLVISSMTGGQAKIPSEYEPRLAEAEYSGKEPHTFATLAQRRQLIAGCPICQTVTGIEVRGSITSGGHWGWKKSFA
jgi:hypothetical protein